MKERDYEFRNNGLEESRTELNLGRLEAVSGGADSLSDLVQQITILCKTLDMIHDMNNALLKNALIKT
jgi:hypothetical protein